jgi:NAD(P)-dependent dehydrogenase (short-subunit alcohol dehydrogenase family)
MSELRFDGRVAIVTGAGGHESLGRAYAHLLAAREARVVVNDLGVGPDGRSVLRADPDAVVDEIRAAGGEAIADTNSVGEEESARAVVQTAIDAWGRVDILINNAGVAALAPFDEVSSNDIRRMVEVHLMGHIWMCRAAWPHMREARYGRIVNITSAASWGMAWLAVYGAVKGGIVSLSGGLAAEGVASNIKVNAFGPTASTRGLRYFVTDPTALDESKYSPELAASVVAYLAHEDCAFSGKCLHARGGWVTEVFLGQTRGYGNDELSPEDVVDNLEQILDRVDSVPIPDIARSAAEAAADFRPYEPASKAAPGFKR